ncbi:molybdopterin-dependent oxidoreductase [Oceanicella sp. SM1341]|uniref:molybdopterin-dependent oxidoreductase n=1 Tax=Oceanicella sp. SM1341 TaxID=1548889 RepID=UPI000E476C53|nr:molybdopterin-dependent oxidoreductase [Oceanicella sp. SM1341]
MTNAFPPVLRIGLRAIAIITALAAMPGGAALAQETMLTLSNANLPAGSNTVMLDEQALEDMPQRTLNTTNEFVDGKTDFTGPLARDVISLIGRGSATRVRLTAVNDYTVEVDLAEFEQYDVIFALAMNGERLSLRDKGPIWVIYPMDDHAELQDPSYNNRLIWQLVKVELK